MLTLRRMLPADCVYIAALNRGKSADYLYQWAGRHCYTYPLTEQQLLHRFKNDKKAKFFMILNDYDVIGCVELKLYSRKNRNCRVCRFLIDGPYRNRGYGRQALNILTSYAFHRLKMKTVSLVVYDFNASAIACYQKAGFVIIKKVKRPYGWNAFIMEMENPMMNRKQAF